MSGEMRLTLRGPLRDRVDVRGLAWAALPGMTASAMAQQPVWVEGRGQLPLGEVFEVAGGPGPCLRFIGDLSLVDGIGAGLAAGEVVVEGNAGSCVGGRMTGGLIEIRGDVGPRAGGAEAGAKRGMQGGEIIVRGSADREAGIGMRRGLVVVQGRAGHHAGRGMLAGSVLVFGALAEEPGLFSRRGSIVAFGPHVVPATYRYACTYRPPHLRVTLSYLQARRGVPVTAEQLAGPYRRYSGDLAELGAGEILAWTR